jgi:hypothetical protein
MFVSCLCILYVAVGMRSSTAVIVFIDILQTTFAMSAASILHSAHAHSVVPWFSPKLCASSLAISDAFDIYAGNDDLLRGLMYIFMMPWYLGVLLAGVYYFYELYRSGDLRWICSGSSSSSGSGGIIGNAMTLRNSHMSLMGGNEGSSGSSELAAVEGVGLGGLNKTTRDGLSAVGTGSSVTIDGQEVTSLPTPEEAAARGAHVTVGHLQGDAGVGVAVPILVDLAIAVVVDIVTHLLGGGVDPGVAVVAVVPAGVDPIVAVSVGVRVCSVRDAVEIRVQHAAQVGHGCRRAT